jgi:DMSO/TMAO reductase YedYZ molybdopterin-dependent catalytic subunit
MLLFHVAIAVCVVPLLLVHAWGRRQRPHRTDLSRRTLLKAGGLAAGAAALWAAGEGALRLTGAPGADRRGTGSLEHGTDDPTAMPVTQWFTDTVPGGTLDGITVVVGDQQARIPISDLDRGDRVRAVLDCTGGWYAAQDWAGIHLDRLLSEVTGKDLPDEGSIDVISRTGYRRRLPLRDASSLLLATSAAGQALSDGHGAPARLVAPGRRGFWWVKWVARIEVVDAPWWHQPPFPLQ